MLVVVSALSGVTNELTAIADGAPDSRDRVAALVERHEGFLAELGLGREVLAERLAALQGLLDDARAATRPLAWQAEVLGQGELLSSTLGAAYLHASGLDMGWMDARQWLDAMPPQPNQSDWSQRLSVNCQWRADAEWMQRFRAQPTRLLITQGFISRHADGGTAILGRGGSDTSAAYFGALLGASRVEIWTDVPGMFSANPRDVPDARLLTRLDYYEAQEIATTGAKVLHPRSIKPCRDAGVPMAILDTERPELPGTSIDGSAAPVPGVKAISRRNGIVLVSMEGIGMWQQVGFLADVFNLFKKHGLSVDLIGSAETNVTVSLDPSENLVNTDVLAALSADLSQICKVKVIVPCAAITLVGRGMRSLLQAVGRVGHVRPRTCAHDFSIVQRPEPDLRHRRGRCRWPAADPACRADRQRCDAGGRNRSVRPTLARDCRHRAPARHAVVARPACAPAAAGRCRYAALRLPPADGARPRRALAAIKPIDQRYYAIKANSHPAILQLLEAEGFGLECVSHGELKHVFQHLPELSPRRVLFTPSFCPRSEYEAAFALGVTVTVDNVEALQRWPDLFRNRELWLRVDLGRGEGHHAKVRTGGKDSKFGLPIARVDEFVRAATELGSRVVGLHAHLGSGVETAQHWRLMCDELAGFARRIGSVQTIDIGGGLPIPYSDEDEPFDLDAWAEGLAEVRRCTRHSAWRSSRVATWWPNRACC